MSVNDVLCLEIIMQYSFFISAQSLVFPGSDNTAARTPL